MNFKRNKIAVLAIIIVVVGLGAIFLRNNQEQDQETPAISQTPMMIPSDWQSYTNDTYNYQISFPPDFEVSQNGENSIMILNTSQDNPVGPASFVYVSVAERDKDVEPGAVYNYNPSFFNIFDQMKVGDTRSVADVGSGQDEWYEYERVSDKKISGEKAKAFVNRKPWEFPGGTMEYLTFFEKGDNLYILGGYLHEEEITKEIFDQIISSFSL